MNTLGSGIKYQLHRANLAMTFLFLSGIDCYLVIPRQKGKTQSAIAIILWAYLFGTSNSEIMFLNKALTDANNNLARLKAQRDLLPAYMQSKELLDENGKIVKGTDNVQTIINPVQNNKIVTKPSASSKDKAKDIGRGNSQPIQMLDEVEFTNFIYEILMSSAPAYKTASYHAKRNRAVHCRLFLTTPKSQGRVA